MCTTFDSYSKIFWFQCGVIAFLDARDIFRVTLSFYQSRMGKNAYRSPHCMSVNLSTPRLVLLHISRHLLRGILALRMPFAYRL